MTEPVATATDPPAPQARRVCIVANGCHENHMDAALIKRFLGDEQDYVVCDEYREADVILVFGCSVTQHMEDESRELIEHLQEQKRPDAELFVLGCITRVSPELRSEGMERLIPIDEIEGLISMDEGASQLAVSEPYEEATEIKDFVAGRKRRAFERYTGLVGGARARANRVKVAMFDAAFGLVRRYKEFLENRINVHNDKTCCIKISTGCRGNCSYCSIRLSRGDIKSKTISDVLDEIKRGLDAGCRQFALMGTDIGDYGKDRDSGLGELLDAVHEIEAPFRLKLRNVNPRWLIPHCEDLCRILEQNRITYIQSPVQSGSDRVLGLMRRGYRAGDFLTAACTIHERFPTVVLRTQIIAGFPTETDEEFKMSMGVISSGAFDYVDVFRYTKRPSTDAFEIVPDVPFDVIMKRYRRAIARALLNHPIRKFKAVRRLSRG